MHLGLNKTTQFYLRPQKFILDSLIFSNTKKATISLLLLILSSSFLGQSNLLAPISIDFFSTNYPNYEFESFIYVGIKRQKLYVFKHQDIICSRILRLEGLERGINKDGIVDSYNRNIYIHGTNEEGLIGTKASHGCIRMKNKDIIDLYNMTAKGMLVIIIDN